MFGLSKSERAKARKKRENQRIANAKMKHFKAKQKEESDRKKEDERRKKAEAGQKKKDEAAAKKHEKYVKKQARKNEESESLTKTDTALARHKYAVLYRMPNEKEWRLIVTHNRADYLKDVAYVVKRKCYSVTSSDNKHDEIKEIIEDGGVVKHIGTGVISDMKDVYAEKKRQKREARMDELKHGDGTKKEKDTSYKSPKKPKSPRKPKNDDDFDMDDFI